LFILHFPHYDAVNLPQQVKWSHCYNLYD
jgi:hypothetical protein